MAITTVNLSDTFRVFVQKANEISTNLGDIDTIWSDSDVVRTVNLLKIITDNLDSSVGVANGAALTLTTTAKDNLINAINELDADVGPPSSLGTNVTSNLVNAINELETAIRGSESQLVSAALNTTSNDLLAAVNEHETDIGDMTFTGLTATDISAALRELRTELGNVLDINNATGYTATTATTGVTEIQGKIGEVTAGNMGTTASTVVTAINEIENEVDTLNTFVEPTQALTTTAVTLADAVNELDGEIGNVSALTTTDNADLVVAINELNRRLVDVFDSDGTLLNT